MLTLELPPEIERRLEALAKTAGRSTAQIASEAILEQLEDLEDLYLAENELKEVWAGRSKTTSLEDVMKEHGLAD